MTTNKQIEQGKQVLNSLIKKALDNPEFKDYLIKSPELAISEFTGREITSFPNKKVVVEDQTNESIIYLNIPHKVDIDDVELSTEELETVSGGTSLACVGGAVAVIQIVEWLGDGWNNYKSN